MIHGPGNKGNLNLLYKLVSKNIPWTLGAFENKRSFCVIDNLMFLFKELIEREDIPSGIYNVADDEPLSTKDLIRLIAKSQNRNPNIGIFQRS
jgi:nucleoside-diphosphate-sugar epimerase